MKVTDKHTRHSELILAGQIRERRLNGDTRPLSEVARELLQGITSTEAKRYLVQHLCDLYRRLARKDSLCEPEHEVELQLPFVTGDIGRYRTSPLVRVRRDGVEDFIKADVVHGTEINRHDSWDVMQRQRAVAHATKRKTDNLAHTKELVAIGFDPATQTNHDMHKLGDIRCCVLCGEGPIPGDDWEVDHETPVVVGEGAGRQGWAHRSCNRSKGSAELNHRTTEGRP